MVIVQLLGGMGNQMFQYACGKQLALNNDTDLKLDTSILLDWTPGRHLVNRGFDLDIFKLKPAFANKKEIAPYNTQLMSKAGKIYFHLKKKIGISPAHKERFFHYDASVLQLKGTQYLAGLWQSYKYFQNISDIIRDDFTITKKIDDNCTALLFQIKNCNSVCVNVRRADYINVKQTADVMGFTGIEYYNNALEVMKNKIKDPQFFIFSDDLNWCRENINIAGFPVTFVDHSFAGEKYSSYFQLMIACKNFIIPNSTFGWWAAWLSTSYEKSIIAPAKWFADNSIDATDLIPSSWIRI